MPHFADYGPWDQLSYYNNYGNGQFPGTNWGALHRGSDRKGNVSFLDGHVKFTDWQTTCNASNGDGTNMWAFDPNNPPFAAGMCAVLSIDINKGKFP